ncbi:MAG TPA: pilus assembly PilX N-terminal domain-containing protein [Tepidisphaeraceae bacterium]|jgi:hypothetical protein|nr:pilus assembly PilX N-terminal domain-containing protein [Tepidisphaeraceae bacterium]
MQELNRPHNFRPSRHHRHGVASLLAMLYLMLFTALAVGFYSATTMSVQISKNERSIEQAQLAAESGLQFVRYQLGCIDVPVGTQDSALLTTVAGLLDSQIGGTSNMNGHHVTVNNGVIYMPASNEYTMMDSTTNAQFRAAIWQSGAFLVLKVTGYGSNGTVGRAVQLQFQKATHASTIFNYGVASKSAISMSGNVKITGATDPTKGSVLSATAGSVPLIMTGGPQISGDFSYTNASGVNTYANGTIAGYGKTAANFSQHVHAGVTPPLFPTIDTSSYAVYATNTYSSGGSGKGAPSLVNTIIPPNTNPSFAGGTTIQGVLYIQTPNQVTFSGDVTVQGAIVVENNPKGDPTTNSISFSGNVSATSISTLPTASFSAGERGLTGAFLLAPNFNVSFTGNFGTIGGSIVVSQLSLSGNAGGTVQGTVINLADTSMSLAGNSDIIIASTGTSNYPTGVTFGSKYAPLPGTYEEVAP